MRPYLLNWIYRNEKGGTSVPDWSQIGYNAVPQSLLDDFDYSKNIYDNWNSTETNLDNRFAYLTNLIYMPLVDTSNVTKMKNTFQGCSSLEYVPLLNTNNVNTMQYMFKECSKIKTVPLFNTTNVTNLYYMFTSCSSLIEVPQFNTSNVMYMEGMFYGCVNLTTVPIFNTSKVISMQSMFTSCSSLSNESLNNILAMCIGTTSAYNKTKTLRYIGLSSAQATTCQSLSNWDAFVNAGWTTGY